MLKRYKIGTSRNGISFLLIVSQFSSGFLKYIQWDANRYIKTKIDKNWRKHVLALVYWVARLLCCHSTVCWGLCNCVDRGLYISFIILYYDTQQDIHNLKKSF